MFTVNLTKYGTSKDGAPAPTEVICVREANAVHVSFVRDEEGSFMHKLVQLGDAPGETMTVTVGSDPNCSYTIAYVMNASGKTVETIR